MAKTTKIRLLVLAIAVCFAGGISLSAFRIRSSSQPSLTVTNPAKAFDPKTFDDIAGFSAPSGARAIHLRRSLDGGWTGEWLYNVTLKISPSDITKLLQSSPWPGVKWKYGILRSQEARGLIGEIEQNEPLDWWRKKKLHYMIDIQKGTKSDPKKAQMLAVDAKAGKLWFVAWYLN